MGGTKIEIISKKTSIPSRIWSQTQLRGTCQAYQLKTVLVREVLRTLQSQPDRRLQNKRYENTDQLRCNLFLWEIKILR